MDENLGQKVPFRAGEKQSAFTRLLKLYMGRLLSLPISWIKFAFIYLVIFTTILVIHGRKEAFYFSRRVLSAIQNAISVLVKNRNSCQSSGHLNNNVPSDLQGVQ